ncbi:MAG TPA: hypothetical protein VG961_12310 [Ignavibacteria bacterium]|nr:hypothetical protein [Ignavibacteria bacterium]
MKYVVIAVLVYIAYFILRRILRNVTSAQKSQPAQNPQKKTYDVNMIQDAEYREVKKD